MAGDAMRSTASLPMALRTSNVPGGASERSDGTDEPHRSTRQGADTSAWSARASDLPGNSLQSLVAGQGVALGPGVARSILDPFSANGSASRDPEASIARSAPITPMSTSSATSSRGGELRRSGVTSLPVGGNGSAAAAGVATSVAQGIAHDIARSTVDEVVVRRVEEVLTQRAMVDPSVGEIGRFTSMAQRVADGGGAPVEGGDGNPEGELSPAQEQQWLRFAMSDEFQGLMVELLEDRLLSEIERRGGRYGGWFA